MYKIALIIIALLVIYGIFAFQNSFNNAKVTASRGSIAVLAGWVMVILGSLLINKVDLSEIMTASEVLALEEKNGARLMGALLFGWAYPLIIVELIWGAIYLLRYFKMKNIFKGKILSAK